jgi:hypothetical protein
MEDDSEFTGEAKIRWGLYRNNRLRLWMVLGPTSDHPSWWPHVYPLGNGIDLYRSNYIWDSDPSNEELGTAIATFI